MPTITEDPNVSGLALAYHDISNGVIEQGRDVASAVRLTMSQAFVAIALHQSSERRLVEGRCVLELTQIDLGTFFSEPATRQCRGCEGLSPAFAINHLAGLILARSTVPYALGEWFTCGRIDA